MDKLSDFADWMHPKNKFLYFIYWEIIYPIKDFLRDIEDWFLHRFHSRHRYNTIKLGPPGYYEYGEQMEKAILIIFMKYWEEDRETHYLYDDIADPVTALPKLMEDVGFNLTEEECLNYVREQQTRYVKMEALYNWSKWWLETDPADNIPFTGYAENDRMAYEYREGLLEDRVLHLIEIVSHIKYYWA